MMLNNDPVANANPGQLNSTQLNIVTTVDVAAVIRNRSIDEAVWMMDNSPDSRGKGTTALETVCRQGQVLNWLVYAVDMARRPDGTWPPFAKIVSIVFLEADHKTVHGLKVFGDLKIFGGPDAIRHPLTPSYAYWAGMLLPDLVPGRYAYRLIFEIDAGGGDFRRVQISTPALRVIPLDQ